MFGTNGNKLTWQSLGIALFGFAIVCEQAHVASPIVLAWSHPGLRKIALSRPIETILLPILAIYIMLLLPPAPAEWGIPEPFRQVWWAWIVYWPWNIWHYSLQNYGVCRILGWGVNKWVIVGATSAVMATSTGPFWDSPFPSPWVFWVWLFAIEFNHWLVDIGLSSRVSRHWWLFLAAVLAVGCVGFAWKVPRADHIATLAIPWVIKARWGVGIAHFLYSRWVWKFSDPQVRTLIGRNFFA